MSVTSAVIKEVRLIMSSVENNNNKFWNGTAYSDGTVVCQWGRVGEPGQSKTFAKGSTYSAEAFLESKRKEKEGKGYAPQRTVSGTGKSEIKIDTNHDIHSLATDQIQFTSPRVKELVAYLAKVNAHNITNATTIKYDASKGTFSTPLGIVTPDATAEARDLLTKIGAFVVKQDYDDPQLSRLISQYLMLIPQNIGRSRPNPKSLYPDASAIIAQGQILDSLDASFQTMTGAPKSVDSAGKKTAPKLFDVRLDLIEDGKQIDRIRKKYKSTNQSMHACAHLDVKQVYEVRINHMSGSFECDGVKIGNIMELWHGTRAGNLLSILKSGFMIPPKGAPYVTGRMFGDGLYFSDQSTKSLNYAYGYWGSANRDSNCFMFLINVAMGKSYIPSGPSQNLPVAGYDSTFAKAGVSGVMNNEMIVYKTCQVDPCFLVEFSPNGR